MELTNDDSKIYEPHPEFEEYATEPLVDLNLTDSTELWLIKFSDSKFGQNLLNDIDGKELSFELNKEGTLASFEGASGETYDFVNIASTEPDETVFVSSATESKIAGKISRRVSVVHYPDPRALEKISSTDPNQKYQNSIAAASQFVPMQGSSQRRSRASATKTSRWSSLSELSKGTNTPKRRGRPEHEFSRGHSSGVSAISSDHSHGGKSKRRKHTE